MKDFPMARLVPMLAAAAFLALLPKQAMATRFGNQFVEFELPPQWACNLEGAEWICQNTNEQKKREAIIVLAAKLKGEQDSLDQYLGYLKAPKNFTSVAGKAIHSEPKYAKTVMINDHAWVDSLHGDSEVPGFFTRYLATIKNDIGVLVTYSINKSKYQQYIEDFDTMVKTLKVFRKPGGLNPIRANNDPTAFPTTAPPIDPMGTPGGNPDPQPQKPKEDDSMLPLLAIAGVVGFIIWRRRRNAAD